MTLAEMTRQKLEQLAAEYRMNGYAVAIHPTAADVPDALHGFEPDLIATSQNDNVVVEVETPSSFNAASAGRLAEAVEDAPGWRFEVVFVNQPVAPGIPADESLARDAQVERLLSNAEMLSAEGQIEAAVMLAWSAAEAILRRTALSAAPELERQSSARVLKHLYSLGHIEPLIFEKLMTLMQFRNAVAHGFEPKTAAPSISDVVPAIRRLQRAA